MPKPVVNLLGNLSSFDASIARLRVKDFSPVMEKISRRYLKTMARRGWSASGLHSISGELKRAITPFDGKRSAGVGLRTSKGRDKVLPKAIAHTYGVKKHSGKRRSSKTTRRSPWGTIPARPFMPGSMPESYQRGAQQLIADFIDDQS